MVDQSTMLEDETILNMVHFIVRNEGIFLGSSSGANLCAAYLLAKRMGPGKKVVTILCDSGQKYVSKIYNPDFLRERHLKVTGKPEDLFPILDRRF
jgi:cysteine synthase A